MQTVKWILQEKQPRKHNDQQFQALTRLYSELPFILNKNRLGFWKMCTAISMEIGQSS